MFEFIDFNQYEQGDLAYGGDAGKKLNLIIDGENWLIKYPQRSKSTGERNSSYSNSPLSEYLGSHIYASLGIPVQETALGERDGILVVGCKDFRAANEELQEFKALKNTYLPSDGREGKQGSGNGTILSDVLDVIDNQRLLSRIDGVKERFWDMFVVDYMMSNSDRNNTNWGVLYNREAKTARLAPVYDNGRAFIENRLLDFMDVDDLLSPEASKQYQCNFFDDDGKYICPYDILASHAYKDADEALCRFVERYDHAAIISLFNGVPESVHGILVMSEAQHEFYGKLLGIRYDNSIIPIYNSIEIADYVIGLPKDLNELCERYGDRDDSKIASGTLGKMRDVLDTKPTAAGSLQQRGDSATAAARRDAANKPEPSHGHTAPTL
jgi:hypothetical protein